jgi:hypothetical protein
MPAYIVAYDLKVPGQKYECIRPKIEAYGTYWHFQQSVWLVQSDDSAETIHTNLSACLDANDKLFVARLEGEAAWEGYDKDGNDWIYNLLT